MGKLLQTLTLAGFTCFTFMTAPVAQAQDTIPDKKTDKLGEYDEIIIKRKSNQDGKVTIEIKDGEVWVDGKKMEAYKDGDLSVFRRKITPRDGNAFSFNGPHRGMQFFNDDEDNDNEDSNDNGMSISGNKALLGVITEKKEATGVTVKEVSKGSPAEKAGLKKGDIITAIDADKIKEPQDLFDEIGEHDPGDKVTVTYLRNSKENKVTVTLDERKDMGAFNFTPPGAGNNNLFRFHGPRSGQGFGDGFGWFNDRSNGTRLGLSVQDTENGEGARVLDVTEGSAAAKAGFKENDIITEIAGTEVKAAKDVVSTYQDNKDKGTITAKVKRNNKVQTLAITIPKQLNKADL